MALDIGASLGGFFSLKMVIGLLAFVFVSLLVGIIVIMRMTGRMGKGKNKFPIVVEIYEARSENIVMDIDHARRIQDTDKGTVLELKNRKVKIPPIPLSFFISNKSGKSRLILYTKDNEKYLPLKPSFSKSNDVELLEEKAWDIVDYRTGIKLRELYKTQTFLEKWGNFLYLIIFGFILLMLLFFVFSKIGGVIDAVNGMVGSANAIAESNRELTTQIITALQQTKTIPAGSVASSASSKPPF